MAREPAQPDVSVIVPCHAEGRLLVHTLASIDRARRYALDRGVTTELLLVLDRPDRLTAAFVAASADRFAYRTEEVEHGDLGLTRNHGIQMARGRFVVLMDGDDLMSENWLAAAVLFLQEYPDTVVHPEYHVVFGAIQHLWRRRSSTDPACDLGALLENNLWDANCAAGRETFLAFPYQPTISEGIFGYEDWHFNCETLAAGIEHLVVPETVHFIRRKAAGSVLAATNAGERIMPPSAFFDTDFFPAQCSRRTAVEKEGIYHDLPPFFDSAYYLEANPDIARSGMDPLEHFLRHGRQEGRLPVPPDFQGSWQELACERYPFWLLKQWHAIHALEPRLYPSRFFLANLPSFHLPAPRLKEGYLELLAALPDRLSHVFLVSWLIRGGADLVALNYVQLVAKRLGAEQVAVIATTDTDSCWQERLPDGVRFIEMGKMCRYLEVEEQERLLARLLLQKRPAVLHMINSGLGFRAVSRYGQALSRVSRLFACAFCWDMTPEGERFGYSVMLPECFDSLDGVFLDNAAHAAELAEVFGLDAAKMTVHYQPVRPAALPVEPLTGVMPWQVLWAGRLDAQKRPGLVLDIARQCRDLPVVFHVYGTPELDRDFRTLRLLEEEPNIVCHGAFDGFSSLPLESFHLFLYTSAWDGLPNVLIEAMAAGLPVLSSDPGGVRELVRDNDTGFCVSVASGASTYRRRLEEIIHSPDRLAACRERGLALVKERHTWNAFSSHVSRHAAYLP